MKEQMVPDKLPNMVAVMANPKRRPGRPRKFEEGFVQCYLSLPRDLREAVEKHQENRKLVGFAEAVRDLLRLAAEAKGLTEPRK